MGARDEKTLAVIEDNWMPFGPGITSRLLGLRSIKFSGGHTKGGDPEDTCISELPKP